MSGNTDTNAAAYRQTVLSNFDEAIEAGDAAEAQVLLRDLASLADEILPATVRVSAITNRKIRNLGRAPFDGSASTTHPDGTIEFPIDRDVSRELAKRQRIGEPLGETLLRVLVEAERRGR